MTARSLSLLAATFLVGALAPLSTYAGDAAKLSPAQIAQDRSKIQVANGLIVFGRAEKDPEMLMMAARILAGVKGDVAEPKAATDGKPVYYDVAKIVAEAKSLPANTRSETMPTKEMNAGFCHYEYLCDSLSCAYEYVC